MKIVFWSICKQKCYQLFFEGRSSLSLIGIYWIWFFSQFTKKIPMQFDDRLSNIANFKTELQDTRMIEKAQMFQYSNHIVGFYFWIFIPSNHDAKWIYAIKTFRLNENVFGTWPPKITRWWWLIESIFRNVNVIPFHSFFLCTFFFSDFNFSKNMHTSRLAIEKFWYEWMLFKQQQKQLALISSNRKDWYSKQNPKQN